MFCSSRSFRSFRSNLGSAVVRMTPALLVCLLPFASSSVGAGQAKHQQAHAAPVKTYLGSDVLATVEGEKITRQEFTSFWLKVDIQASRPLGIMLLNQVNAPNAKGLASNYNVRETDIYQALYSGDPGQYSTFLSNLVTSHLVAQEAKRKGIVITQAEAERAGRELLNEARSQQKLLAKLSDNEILTKFRVPRDLFLDQMVFKLRGERLLAQSIAARNGHPIGADDWIALRQLFAGANLGTDAKKNEQEFIDAHERIKKWVEEVKSGKSFAEVASAHNEDDTRTQGGLRGAALLGTGTKAVEEVVGKLKPGQMSAPLRTKDGWYVFEVERRGTQIPAGERAQLWKQITEKRVTPFLVELRKHAHITSVIPLPADTLTTPTTGAQPTAPASGK